MATIDQEMSPDSITAEAEHPADMSARMGFSGYGALVAHAQGKRFGQPAGQTPDMNDQLAKNTDYVNKAPGFTLMEAIQSAPKDLMSAFGPNGAIPSRLSDLGQQLSNFILPQAGTTDKANEVGMPDRLKIDVAPASRAPASDQSSSGSRVRSTEQAQRNYDRLVKGMDPAEVQRLDSLGQ